MVKREYKYLLLLELLLGVGLSKAAFAANLEETNFSITLNPSLNLSVSSEAVNLPITPNANGVYGSTFFTVTSATNNLYGYTLTMSTEEGRTYLESTTANMTTGEKPRINTLTATQEGISAEAFAAATTEADGLNRWGIAIDNGNFKAVASSMEVKKTATNNSDAGDTTTINIAAKLNLDIPAAVYKNKFNFQMVVNQIPAISLEDAYHSAGKTKATINGHEYYAMQDMTPAICNAVTDIETQVQVYDKRDNKIYYISKLADGNCWMTQNLDHDIVAIEGFYTNQNTDIGYNSATGSYDTASWTAEYATHTSSDNYWCEEGLHNGTCNTSFIASYDPGDLYWNGELGNISAGDDKVSNTGDSHYHLGNYYNWSAAVATNDISSIENGTLMDRSICPSGWKLPHAGTGEDSFFSLLNQYGFSNSVSQNNKKIWDDPLFFGLLGLLTTSVSINDYIRVGYSGSWWTSNLWSGTDEEGIAYVLYINGAYGVFTGDDGLDSGYVHLGNSIRCIAR